ncbi:helix-turn-helix domain-containing protein [Actinoalloteichus hymeniacidonis]|nr:helix-turn-helix transcriptional regulator [Actinoalloteichus hymeniacidonis]
MSRVTRTPRARALGHSLRTLREQKGMSAREVGRRIGVHSNTISRYENATKVISVNEVSALLGAMECSPEERNHVLKLTEDIGRPNWYVSQSHIPDQMSTLIMYEQEAAAITAVSLVLIPGLLQTRDYARAVISPVVPASDPLVMSRMGRKDVLDRENPVRLTAVLDEAVLSRAVGGPAIMATQLRYLLRQVERGVVDVRVLPFSAGVHAAMSGPFDVLEFADASPIIYVESLARGEFVDEADDVNRFLATRDTVIGAAMNTADSAALIAARAELHAESEAS